MPLELDSQLSTTGSHALPRIKLSFSSRAYSLVFQNRSARYSTNSNPLSLQSVLDHAPLRITGLELVVPVQESYILSSNFFPSSLHLLTSLHTVYRATYSIKVHLDHSLAKVSYPFWNTGILWAIFTATLLYKREPRSFSSALESVITFFVTRILDYCYHFHSCLDGIRIGFFILDNSLAHRSLT